MALLYWQKAASYAQTRFLDILQYIASQSTPKRPAQPQIQGTGVQKPTAPSNHSSAATPPPQDGQPPSPASSAALSEQNGDATEEEGPSENSKAAPATAALNEQKTTPTQALVESSKTSISSEEQVIEIESVPPVANESAQASMQDASVEESGRLTRARTRKARAANASNR
ncbi:hypothetical protein CDL12_18487 [Handroanthus impetiginosus]|uniref:Uncharacterized protein n=1 Tax=Handroanthus impetiginosus TaxID=429701 RepID=A0A2G9GVA8_9LAMI|nr:hypothetical protein CDL12_18487 [Handroanthus impetiginosus]